MSARSGYVILLAVLIRLFPGTSVLAASENTKTAEQFYKEHPEAFEEDLNKYRYSKGTWMKKSVQIMLPVGIGAALAASMGPQAAIPITIGSITAAVTLNDILKKRSVRHLMQGAYYHLQGEDISLDKKQKKKLKKFYKFFNKNEKRLASGSFSDMTRPEMESSLATHLLRLNRFGWIIAHRFNTDKSLRNLNRPKNKVKRFFISNKTPDKGNLSKAFIKRNLLTLIEMDREGFMKDIPPGQVYQMNQAE